MSDLNSFLPSYSSIQESLSQLDSTTNCAEAHGALCGLLIDNRNASEWLSGTLSKTPESQDLLASEHIKNLKSLYNVSKQQLNNEELSFELLLPEDDIELSKRLQALSDWCQGFLFGLGSISKIDEKNMAPDVKEFMTDLLGITQLETDEESNNENEQDFAEIVEYVRMGVIYINELLNPVHTSTSLH